MPPQPKPGCPAVLPPCGLARPSGSTCNSCRKGSPKPCLAPIDRRLLVSAFQEGQVAYSDLKRSRLLVTPGRLLGQMASDPPASSPKFNIDNNPGSDPHKNISGCLPPIDAPIDAANIALLRATVRPSSPAAAGNAAGPPGDAEAVRLRTEEAERIWLERSTCGAVGHKNFYSQKAFVPLVPPSSTEPLQAPAPFHCYPQSPKDSVVVHPPRLSTKLG